MYVARSGIMNSGKVSTSKDTQDALRRMAGAIRTTKPILRNSDTLVVMAIEVLCLTFQSSCSISQTSSNTYKTICYNPSLKNPIPKAWQYIDFGFTIEGLHPISPPTVSEPLSATPRFYLFPSSSPWTWLVVDPASQAILSWLSPTTSSLLRLMIHRLHMLFQPEHKKLLRAYASIWTTLYGM